MVKLYSTNTLSGIFFLPTILSFNSIATIFSAGSVAINIENAESASTNSHKVYFYNISHFKWNKMEGNSIGVASKSVDIIGFSANKNLYKKRSTG